MYIYICDCKWLQIKYEDWKKKKKKKKKKDYIYTVHYRVFHSLHCLFIRKSWRHFVPPSNWLHTIWIYLVCYDLKKEFVFSHDKAASLLKEYVHALEMDKTHIYVVFTYTASFQWRHLFVLMRKHYGRHVNFYY